MNERSSYLSALGRLDLPFALTASPLIYGFIAAHPILSEKSGVSRFGNSNFSISKERGSRSWNRALLSTFSIFYQFGGLGFVYPLAVGLVVAAVASYGLEALILLDAICFSLTPFFYLTPALIIFGDYEFGSNSGRNQGLIASLVCLGLAALLGNPMRNLFPSIVVDLPVLEATKPLVNEFTPKVLLEALKYG